MSTRPEEAGNIKVGSFIVIDGEPCKVVEVEKSKTGKHGSAKARIVGIGFFDGGKRSIVVPTDARVEVPIIKKFTAQVVAFVGDNVQLMNLEDYSTFEIPMPQEEEIKSKLSEGVEVEVWEVMGRHKIMRVRA
ncbi:translation initiation factor IF-5A [Thermofilum pendens]|uniref:Translation initiation factor 5A n=1 Tax=Thermofilum pendens (strain DSM 2475 / Hrk 5) TaxID=368408 RepID=IF5A_THEPD|nr:translation initiation factor IF-5A [Thermofilum pendens]A1RX88.1 RecName: Full=Translation initiation factor 5A; AltName: Full=Hypusine-containing protein; AltName: Full=eIF-5A [Thermofilum pendens Hrk 5]ABL77818.1 translation initiation factor 5A (eIF-5A) [Thermofilum pendens Hrk 5]